MRIGINTLAINRQDFGGAERYLYFLLCNMAKIDQENEYFVFVSPQNQDRFTINQKNFKTIVCPINLNSRVKRILYEQSSLPKFLKKYKIDVFHAPQNVIPFGITCKCVLTIQYMFSFMMPKDHPPFYRRWYLNTLTKLSARRANKVISVSYDNKRQIIRYLGIKESKVSAIHHGLDNAFYPVKDLNIIKACKDKYGISSDYILCVANNVLNKNLEGVIKAFRYLKQHYTIPHLLVIAGSVGFSQERKAWLREIINKYPDIIHTGYVDSVELRNLYSGASVFAFPSYYESFGIPLLEAMACGVPIVTSNVFAMPEVVADAGLKINPYDFKEIGDAIYTLLTNPTLREDFIRRGFERVKKFSWETAAKETLKVFEEVYKS